MWWPLDQPAKDVTQSISGCYTSNGTCPLDTFITRSLSYMPGNGDPNAVIFNFYSRFNSYILVVQKYYRFKAITKIHYFKNSELTLLNKK